MASNAVLGVIAFFAVGAVRQFCAFAIVVLTAHWFLAHTFFIAVLSIDIARLEVRLTSDEVCVQRLIVSFSLKSYCVMTLASRLRLSNPRKIPLSNLVPSSIGCSRVEHLPTAVWSWYVGT